MTRRRGNARWQFSLKSLFSLTLIVALGAAAELYLPGVLAQIALGLLFSVVFVGAIVLLAALYVFLFSLPLMALWLIVTKLSQVFDRSAR